MDLESPGPSSSADTGIYQARKALDNILQIARTDFTFAGDDLQLLEQKLPERLPTRPRTNFVQVPPETPEFNQLEARVKHLEKVVEELRSHTQDANAGLAELRSQAREAPQAEKEEDAKGIGLALIAEEPPVDPKVAPDAEGGVGLRHAVHDSVREVGTSVWEASIFIGLPGLPKSATIMVFLGILFNLAAQGIFCLIIADQFLGAKLPKPEDTLAWRVFAHDLGQMDPVSGSSLVSRVCKKDAALQVAAEQASVLNYHDVYLSKLPVLKAPTGPLLFALSWTLWYIVSFNEASNSLSYLLAVWHVPRGKSSILQVTEEGYRFEQIHSCRVLIVMLVTLFRLGICGTLAVCGSFWLANQFDPTDLVLNAAALGFVLDLDGMLFEAWMPQIIQLIVSNVEPLTFRKQQNAVLSCCLDRIGVRPFAGVVMGAVSGYLLLTVRISDNIDKLEELKDILCGGSKTFVMSENPVSGMLLARQSNPFTGESNPLMDRKTTAFRQLRGHNFAGNWSLDVIEAYDVYLTPTQRAFNTLQFATVQDHAYNIGYGYADCNSDFADIFPPGLYPPFLLAGLAQINNGIMPDGCKALFDGGACERVDSSFARVLCPTQCGCGDPLSGIYYGGPLMGCPRQKCMKSVHWEDTVEQLPCADKTPQELATDAGWLRYWRAFEEAEDFSSGGTFVVRALDLNAPDFAAYAKVEGCSALVDEQLIYSFCKQTPRVNSLTAFCPRTCGCTVTPDDPGCPKQCKGIKDAYEGMLNDLPCTDMVAGTLYNQIYTPFHATTSESFDKNWDAIRLITYFDLTGGAYDLLDFVNDHGCVSELMFRDLGPLLNFCGFIMRHLDLQALCPEMCSCYYTGAYGCPRTCGTGMQYFAAWLPSSDAGDGDGDSVGDGDSYGDGEGDGGDGDLDGDGDGVPDGDSDGEGGL